MKQKRSTRSRRPQHSLEKRLQAVLRVQAGERQQAIARDLKMHQSSVSRAYTKAIKRNTLANLPHRRRPRKIPQEKLEYIALQCKRGHFRTTPDVQQYLQAECGVRVVRTTVHNTLHRLGLEVKKVHRHEELTPEQRKERLAFAIEHEHKTVDWWKRVVFLDEAGIHRQETGRPQYVIGPIGDSATAIADEIQLAHGGGRINIWGALSCDGMLCWDIYKETLTAEKYKELLETTLFPAAKARFRRRAWMLEQDNATPHTGKGNTAWVNQQAAARNFTVLKWPVNSPDFSPIEEFWLELKTVLAKLGTAATLNERRAQTDAAIHKFNAERGELFAAYYSSLPRRMKLAIEAKGKRINY
jgi:transposase